MQPSRCLVAVAATDMGQQQGPQVQVSKVAVCRRIVLHALYRRLFQQRWFLQSTGVWWTGVLRPDLVPACYPGCWSSGIVRLSARSRRGLLSRQASGGHLLSDLQGVTPDASRRGAQIGMYFLLAITDGQWLNFCRDRAEAFTAATWSVVGLRSSDRFGVACRCWTQDGLQRVASLLVASTLVGFLSARLLPGHLDGPRCPSILAATRSTTISDRHRARCRYARLLAWATVKVAYLGSVQCLQAARRGGCRCWRRCAGSGCCVGLTTNSRFSYLKKPHRCWLVGRRLVQAIADTGVKGHRCGSRHRFGAVTGRGHRAAR